MDNYIVTGVSGFIASKVAEQLLEEGHSVIGIDNMNEYYDISIKNYRLEYLKKYDYFSFYKIDIENKDAFDDAFSQARVKCVFNLAARAGVRYSMENPYVYLSTNTLGVLNTLELMRKHDVEKLVLASTSSLYAGQPMPFNENLSVNTPISPYAASKKAAEMFSHSYHHLYDLDISIVRYFTVFGPAGRPDMCIFRFIKWIDEGVAIELFGDGNQSRDFTYVDDVARGTILAQKKLGYKILNLGGGMIPVSLNEIIKYIENKLDKKAVINHKPFHKADISETSASIGKAKELLDWEPEMEFWDGFDRTIEWYIQNRNWLKEVKL